MTVSSKGTRRLLARGKPLSLNRCRVMGIVNTTPDSFSDGGLFFSADRALNHALSLIKDGADILDIGGMSTRPGAPKIDPDEELRRVLPVIEGLRALNQEILISIDTTRPRVAAAALERGVHIINSVRALEDEPEIGRLASLSGAGLVLMHSSGTSDVMQQRTEYGHVPGAQLEYLRKQCALAESMGVKPESLAIDPGFGFGKTLEQNLTLLHELHQFEVLNYAILVGLSRKSFLGRIGGIEQPGERDAISHVAGLIALKRGARILRVHDVRGARQSLDITEAVDQRAIC